MKFVIKHEIRGRLHVHLIQKRMTFEEADTLQYYLSTNKYITSVKVYQRTCDVAVTYVGGARKLLRHSSGLRTVKSMCRTFLYRIPAGNSIRNTGTSLSTKWYSAVEASCFYRIRCGQWLHDKVCPLYMGRHQVSGTR